MKVMHILTTYSYYFSAGDINSYKIYLKSLTSACSNAVQHLTVPSDKNYVFIYPQIH